MGRTPGAGSNNGMTPVGPTGLSRNEDCRALEAELLAAVQTQQQTGTLYFNGGAVAHLQNERTFALVQGTRFQRADVLRAQGFCDGDVVIARGREVTWPGDMLVFDYVSIDRA